MNEGAAARELLAEAATSGPRDAALLRRIAREEVGHARLGLDVAQWGAAVVG